jgi:hypothetical protein
MEVPVEFDRRVKPGSVKAGSPRKVFSRSGFAEDQGNLFAVLPDGKRFVVTEPVGPAPRPTITVVRNWATALERK